MKPTPCIACGAELDSAVGDDSEIGQPSGGLMFTTHGNYGSTIFDPFHPGGRGPYLQVIICDECIQRSAERQRVLWIDVIPRMSDLTVKVWEGEE